MKKALAILLTAAVMVAPLSACGGSSEGSNGVVNVYNWGEYMDEDLFDLFEEQTGIKVNYQTYPDNESMYSNLKGGGASYDVIIPSDYMISRMIEEDMLETINFDNIPNFSDIEASLLNPSYDPTNEYSVPYTWGTVGLIYNSAMVEEEITSWSALFDEQYADQVLMFDNSRDCIGIALMYLGYSVNTTNEAEITEATDLLIAQKEAGIVQGYVMDQIFDKLEGGEAAMGPYYAGDFITMQEANPDLVFVVPDEGANMFVDAMCIPKGAENKDNAEAFINFMCSTEAGLANFEAIGYSSPLTSVQESLPDEVKNDPVSYPSDEVLARCEAFSNLPADILALYDSEWIRLKLS